jgi:hypothetical protein
MPIPSQNLMTSLDSLGRIQIGSQSGTGNEAAQNRVDTNAPIGTTRFSGHILMICHVKLAGLHTLWRTS